MTESPQPEPPSAGVDTAHLKDYQQLRRSVDDRKVAGVAGGLGRHLNIDPTVLRVAFVALALFGGAGLVLYGAAWVLVPEQGRSEGLLRTNPATRNVLLIGAALLSGLVLVARSWGGFGFPWPLAVIALVAFVILMNRDKSMNTQYAPPPPGTPPYAVAPRPGQAEGTIPPPDGTTPPPWMPPTPQAYQPPPPRPDRGPKLFGVTLALVAVALGLLGLYDAAGNSVVGAAYPATALAVVGIMLVVGAWVGRAGGLIILGLVAAVALAVSSASSPRFSDQRTLDATPSSASVVRGSYNVPAGQIRLDLRKVSDVTRLDGRTLNVRARAGEILVLLPPDLRAHVNADVSVGEVTVGRRTSDGVQVHVSKEIGPPGAETPEVELDLNLLAGQIEVRQP